MKFKEFARLIDDMSERSCINDETKVMVNLEDISKHVDIVYHEQSNTIDITAGSGQEHTFRVIGKIETIGIPF